MQVFLHISIEIFEKYNKILAFVMNFERFYLSLSLLLLYFYQKYFEK
jgi:hypothetical protein